MTTSKFFRDLRGGARTWWVHLCAGARAACLRYVDPRSLTPTFEQLMVMAVVVIGIGPLLSWTYYSGSVAFNWSELRALWFELPLFILVGAIAARFSRLRHGLFTIAIVLFAAMLVTDAALTLVLHAFKSVLSQRQMYWVWAIAYWGAYVWLVLIGIVLLRRTARLAVRHLLPVVLPLCVLGVYDVFVPPQPLWYELPPPRGEEAPAVAKDSPVSEEMLYLQPRLMQQTLNALQPPKPGISNLYFVGFAPYSYEDVFLKESEVIRTLMDERFGTRGRSVLLVNNNKSLRRYPLATVTNLRATLAHLGKLMNKERDVLVLYLTSHGSEKHRLAASYYPLRLDELHPDSLKALLEESGIKWRVVTISACYAGGFIEPLQGPTSLVMTAADAKHTSFGCGAESDFTYFAKAVFDEQLRDTYSFEAAFQRALPVIRQREQAQREEFSNPQIAVGDPMRKKLAEIEQRLKTIASSRIE